MNASNMTPTSLTPRQYKAIESLLLTGEVTAAAAAARVSKETVYRWLKRSDFQRAVNNAEVRALQSLAGRLVGLGDLAAKTLEDVMSDVKAPPSARVVAAGRVIDALLKMRELVTLEARITALEVGQNDKQIIDAA